MRKPSTSPIYFNNGNETGKMYHLQNPGQRRFELFTKKTSFYGLPAFISLPNALHHSVKMLCTFNSISSSYRLHNLPLFNPKHRNSLQSLSPPYLWPKLQHMARKLRKKKKEEQNEVYSLLTQNPEEITKQFKSTPRIIMQ